MLGPLLASQVRFIKGAIKSYNEETRVEIFRSFLQGFCPWCGSERPEGLLIEAGCPKCGQLVVHAIFIKGVLTINDRRG